MKNIKAIHRRMGTIHQGAGDHKEESIRDKSGGAFSKKEKKEKKNAAAETCSCSKTARRKSNQRGDGEITATCINQTD